MQRPRPFVGDVAGINRQLAADTLGWVELLPMWLTANKIGYKDVKATFSHTTHLFLYRMVCTRHRRQKSSIIGILYKLKALSK